MHARRTMCGSRGHHDPSWMSGLMVSTIGIVVLLIIGQVSAAAVRGNYLGCVDDPRDVVPVMAFKEGSVESCVERCEDRYFSYALLSDANCWCSQNASVAQEVELTRCSTPCSREANMRCGGAQNLRSIYEVALTVPAAPTDVLLTNRTATTINLSWRAPPHTDILTQYTINARILHSYANSTTAATTLPEWVVAATSTRIELVDLHPATAYNFTISSESSAGTGGAHTFVAQTEIGRPDPQPEQPKIVSSSDTTRTIEIRAATNWNGPVSAYRVLVILVDTAIVRAFDESLLGDYGRAQEDGLNFYVAAQLEPFERVRRFTVGDGRPYGGYVNAALPKEAHVHIAIGVVSVQDGLELVRYAETSHEQHDVVIDVPVEEEDADDSQALIITLIVACCLFGLLLVASIVVYVGLRLRMDRRLRHRLPSDQHELTLQGPIVEVENGAYIPDDFLVKGNFEQRLAQMLAAIDDPALRLPRKSLDLEVNNVLGTGRFGDVIRGHVQHNRVQVHVVSDDMEPLDQSQFLQELQQLLGVVRSTTSTGHPNLLRFVGACQTPDWLYLLFEDTPYSLKQRLVEARLEPAADARRLSAFSEEFVLRMLMEISGAMEFLGREQFIHRKLCSYSVRLTIDDDVKVSCFAAVPFDEHGNRVEIARWSAPEVLRFQHYSPQSDVWSFGCLMWECCTLGATLYANISAGDLAARIKTGARPDQPPFLYDDIYQLMLNCWQLEPSDRLTFTDLTIALRHLMTSPQHVLSYDRRGGIAMPFYLPLMEVEQSHGAASSAS